MQKTKAIFHHKQGIFELTNCVIEKVITLTDDKFKRFSEDMLADYAFIEENKELMKVDENGVFHSLLVVGDSVEDGILVEADGHGYARYSAFLPNAKKLLQSHQYDCISQLEKRLGNIVQDMITEGTASSSGKWKISHEELDRLYGLETPQDIPLMVKMLAEREEIRDLENTTDGLRIELKPEYCRNISENNGMKEISEQDLEVMTANHILWLNDAGGKQADFTDADLSDYDLSHKKLMNAIFVRAKLENCKMNHAEFAFSDFTGANLDKTVGTDVLFEEANFTDASLKNARIYRSHFSGSDLTNADFTDAQLNFTKMNNCITTNTDFTDANLIQTQMLGCTDESETESEDNGMQLM